MQYSISSSHWYDHETCGVPVRQQRAWESQIPIGSKVREYKSTISFGRSSNTGSSRLRISEHDLYIPAAEPTLLGRRHGGEIVGRDEKRVRVVRGYYGAFLPL